MCLGPLQEQPMFLVPISVLVCFSVAVIRKGFIYFLIPMSHYIIEGWCQDRNGELRQRLCRIYAYWLSQFVVAHCAQDWHCP